MQFNHQGLQPRRKTTIKKINGRETWTAIHLNEKIMQEVTYLRVN